MNKEQLIEEMAKCKVCYQEFGKCPIGNNPCREYTNAENMYERGYRKVPDGAVILTPEERDEELKACNEKQAELEAEIERLKADNETLQMWNEAYMKENEKLKGKNHKLENDLVDFDKFAKGISKTRIEITGEAIPTCKTVLEYIKKEKRNAVEEFAKKCKERINADYVNGCLNNHKGHLTEYDIDEFVKEFTE